MDVCGEFYKWVSEGQKSQEADSEESVCKTY